jgi:NhaP-type Na+/H+ or K+/H+ antiporter
MRVSFIVLLSSSFLIGTLASVSNHTNTTEHAVEHTTVHHGAEHAKHHVALCFMFVGIALGGVTQYLLTVRFLSCFSGIPYTAILLVEGGGIAFLHEHFDHKLGLFSDSVEMWVNIDPHLLLFIFLPALVFGDAMHLNTHLFKKCFSQCLVLACPGVILGTFGIGWCARYIFPYNWSWELSLMFGSILSATDPVAVVALLSQLGASSVLTMQITGESLLNDGTAIVVFQLFFNMYHDATKLEYTEYDTIGIVKFFARMALGGPALGIAFGMVSVWWMKKQSRTTVESDMTVQIAVTLCCAYLSFFVAEEVCEVSGVLCIVAAALVLADGVWPSVCNEHTMLHFWHAIEYLGNTLIFLLAGLIIGKVIWLSADHNITNEDYWYCFIMFGCMIAVRALMVLVFAIPLKFLGYGTTPKDAFFIVWGGLRGAVGLALAVMVQRAIDPQEGARIIFHVGGLSALTLLVNGVTSGPVLRLLGMVGSPASKRPLLASIRRKVRNTVQKAFETELNGIKFTNVNKTQVLKMVDILGREDDRYWSPEHHMPAMPKTDVANAKRLYLVREIFLHVLKQEYWHMIETESIPKRDHVSMQLLNSIDCASDDLSKPLSDWKILEEELEVPSWIHTAMGCLDRLIPKGCTCMHDWWYELHDTMVNKREEASFHICRAYLTAHEHAQEKTLEIFTSGDSLSPEEEVVVNESKANVAKARARLATMHNEVTDASNSANMARLLLKVEQTEIQKMHHQGLLTGAEADEFMEQVTANLGGLGTQRKHQSKLIAHNHTLERKHLREAAMRVLSRHHRMRLSSVVNQSMDQSSTTKLVKHPLGPPTPEDAKMKSLRNIIELEESVEADLVAREKGRIIIDMAKAPTVTPSASVTSPPVSRAAAAAVTSPPAAAVTSPSVFMSSAPMASKVSGTKVHPGPYTPGEDSEEDNGGEEGDGSVDVSVNDTVNASKVDFSVDTDVKVSKAAVDAAGARRKARREARKQRRTGSKDITATPEAMPEAMPAAAATTNAESWSEEDVSKWLCSIGAAYASYSSSFVENAVNGEVLLDADFAANLVELGVLSKMHQNRIAKEIAKLGA